MIAPTGSSPILFTTPAIRHLAWMLTAPTLLNHPDRLMLSASTEVMERLARWDRTPATAPAELMRPPERRLGLYFERLFSVMMTELLGWQLLGRNLPVRAGGRTLGELDFILRNPQTGDVEHHEIAVKFYLGYPQPADVSAAPCRWYGPNARDRLDLKSRRMLEHQSPMSERPEAREALARAGIDLPRRRRLYMPGYLFYPEDRPCPSPTQAAFDHLRGGWRYETELDRVDTRHWVPLHKPHWIGPWRQTEPPCPEQTGESLAEARHFPRLFAAMAPDPALDGWREVGRCFVVPPHWPEVTSPDTGRTPGP